METKKSSITSLKMYFEFLLQIYVVPLFNKYYYGEVLRVS